MTAAQYELVIAIEKTVVTTEDGEVIRISQPAAIKAVMAGAKTVTDGVLHVLAMAQKAAV